MSAVTIPSAAVASFPALAQEPAHPCLRKDLLIRSESEGGGWIVLPSATGEEQPFSFGEHEFLLATTLDGTRSLTEIRDLLVLTPGLETLQMEHLERLVNWIAGMNLLEQADEREVFAKDDEPAVLPAVPAAESAVKPSRNMGRRLSSALVQAACLAAMVWLGQQAVDYLKYGRASGQIVAAAPAGSSSITHQGEDALTVRYDGVLRELYVRDGDKVEAGEVLAMIDNLEIRHVLDELRDSLSKCQLARDQAYSQHDWTEYRKEVAHMAEITQTMGQLRFEEELTEIRAPHSGVVRAAEDLSNRVGHVISSGQKLLSVEPSDDESLKQYLITSTLR